MKYFSLLVDGNLDEAVGRRIVKELGGSVEVAYGKKGYGYIKNNIRKFDRCSTQYSSLLALVDLMDTGFDCPPDLIRKLLPTSRPDTIFRIAVREIESWLIADRDNISKFLSVSKNIINNYPDGLYDPKQTLINIARRSRSREIKRLLVPKDDSTAVEGPGYTYKMMQFVNEIWDIYAACEKSDSLRRCVNVLNMYIQNNS